MYSPFVDVVLDGENGAVEIPEGTPYRSFFEVMISKIKTRVIQSSEVGALIRGAETLALPSALDRYASRPVPFEKVRGKALHSPTHLDFEGFRKEADDIVASMERAIRIAESGLQVVRQLKRLDPGNKLEQPEMQKKFKKARGLEAEVWTDERLMLLFNRVLSGASQKLRILQADLDKQEIGDPERARNLMC